ncbi:hypothetical protein AB0F91_47250 [Amycolatopsis sp. NPDC023774]|uniref:hypothetical protein n=1 Tax=Amycolatopsis sp. NPDC023774 TaxID=3155015 RepID=UPI0033CC0F6D
MVSFVHRVLLQWWWGATIGRALFGLHSVVITAGRSQTLARCSNWLVLGFFTAISTLSG